MVNNARKARSSLIDAARRLFRAVGQQAESTELSNSQFVEFHLGFAFCLQAAERHEIATQVNPALDAVRCDVVSDGFTRPTYSHTITRCWFAFQHLQLAIRRHHALPLAHVALLRSQLACGQYRQAVEECRRVVADFGHLLPLEAHDEVARLQAIAAEGCEYNQSMGCLSAPLRRAFDLRADDVWVVRCRARNDEGREFESLPARDQGQLPVRGQTSKHQIDHIQRQCSQARHQLGLCRAALDTHSHAFDTGRSSLRPRTASA